MALPSFTFTGNLFDLLGNVDGSEISPNPLGAGRRQKVTFTSNVPINQLVVFDGASYRVKPVEAEVLSDGSIKRNGETVLLLANDEGLNVEGLQWRVDVAGMTVWFDAPADGQSVDLKDIIDEATAAKQATAQSSLDAAVGAYVEANRAQFRTHAELITEGEDAGKYQWYDESGSPTGDPVELSEIVNVDWDAVTTKPAVIAAGADVAEAREVIGAAPHRIMRPNGPRVGVIGDSLMALGYKSTSGSGVAARVPVIFRRLQWLSHQRVRMTDPQQSLGDDMNDVLTTQLPAILAADPAPNACVMAIGRNDASSLNLSDYLNHYADIAGQLFNAGICPIWLTPMPAGAAGSPTAPADANLRALAAGLRELGPKLGVPVFDQYAVLADESGGLKAEYDCGDHTHLTAAGYQAVAESLIDQGFLDLFPGASPCTIKDTANAHDIIGGAGLFKDSSPDGWFSTGSGTTVTFVDPVAGDGIAGRWAKITKADSSTAQGAYRYVSWLADTPPTITAGDVYRFSGTMYADGAWDVDAGTSTYMVVYVEWYNAAHDSVVLTQQLVNRWDGTDRITFSEDFTVPEGAANLRYLVALNGTADGDQHVYVAEMSILNLTDMGVS